MVQIDEPVTVRDLGSLGFSFFIVCEVMGLWTLPLAVCLSRRRSSFT